MCKKRGITLTILRFTQIYGPREPLIKAIPLFIREIAHNHAPTIFGDGSEKRDYLFVSDAALSVVNTIDKKVSGIFNIASGESVTLKETLDMLIAISGKEIIPNYEERKKLKIDIVFDTSKAQTELGFYPQISLNDGLQQSYDWYIDHAL